MFAPLVILLTYGAVVGSMTLFSDVKREMFPLAERAEYLIYLDMPKGTSIGRTRQEAAAKVERIADLLGPEDRGHAVLYSSRILKKSGLRIGG